MSTRVDRMGRRRARAGEDLGEFGDAELLRMVRAGNEHVFGELFRRHQPSAVRYAARLLQRAHLSDAAEDVVSDAFRKTLTALRNGKGPTDTFRPYLYTSVRTMAFNHLHNRRHEHLVDALLERASEPAPSTDARLALDAFCTLPQRWQEVLWATKVMSLSPSEFAANAGLRANSAAALSSRAREGLRIAYVRAHLPPGRSGACRDALDAIARGCVVPTDSSTGTPIGDHVRDCSDCARSLEDLRAHLPTAPTLKRWAAPTVA